MKKGRANKKYSKGDIIYFGINILFFISFLIYDELKYDYLTKQLNWRSILANRKAILTLFMLFSFWVYKLILKIKNKYISPSCELKKEKFLKYANLFHKYHKENQIEKANIYAKRMNTILSDIAINENYKIFLDNVLSSENGIAVIWVCSKCLELNYKKRKAIKLLKKLSKSQDEIIRRDAKMSLLVRLNMQKN